MSAKVVRFVLPVLVLAAVVAPTASAETNTKTVDGEVVFLNGQRPGDPGDCSAVTFVQWADVPGTTNAKAIYTYEGEERSMSAAPPFDDTYKLVADYQVPAGHHWIAVGKGWINGPGVRTCEDVKEKHKQIFGTEARVEVTVEVDPKVCNAAKAKLTARRKSVNGLSSQLRKATTQKARKKLQSRLETAKAKRAKATQRVRDVC